MRDLVVWKSTAAWLEEGKEVAFLLVRESTGSSPGRKGFKMAVTADGELAGSIGGGIMEYRLVEECKKELVSGKKWQIHRRLVHRKGEEASPSGLICSGEQQISILFLHPDQKETFRSIADHYERRLGGKVVFHQSGVDFYGPGKVAYIAKTFDSDANWNLVESLVAQDKVFIIGGGHVGLAVSELLASLDFYVSILDNRADVVTMDRNKAAHEKITTPYDKLGQVVPDGESHYIIIMTFSCPQDTKALRQLIGKKCKYIGMMGSKAKIARVWRTLRSEGVSEELLSSVHTPIGLPINSKTPAEIAVSVAAELIKIRNA